MITPRFFLQNSDHSLDHFTNPIENLNLKEWSITDKTHPSLFNHMAALRLRIGDIVALIDNQGQEWHAKIVQIAKKQINFEIFAQAPQQKHFYIQKKYNYQGQEYSITFDISLFVSLIAQQNLDFLLQKATELGVQNIELLDTQYSQRLPIERMSNKMQHWQHILQHACEQSGRNHLPTLKAPQKLKDHLCAHSEKLNDDNNNEFSHTFIFAIPNLNADLEGDFEGDYKNTNPKYIQNFSNKILNDLIECFLSKYILKNKNTTEKLDIFFKDIAFKINVYIGPEGGFSENEHALFTHYIKKNQTLADENITKANFYSLGQQVLRTETAALAFLSACYLF